MAAGFKSLLAPWIGGVSAAGEQGSVRGMLAPWIGGANAPADATQAGYRGLLAFWMGGASAGARPPPAQPGIGGGSLRLPRRLIDELRHQRIDEDDLLLLMAACLDGNVLLH